MSVVGATGGGGGGSGGGGGVRTERKQKSYLQVAQPQRTSLKFLPLCGKRCENKIHNRVGVLVAPFVYAFFLNELVQRQHGVVPIALKDNDQLCLPIVWVIDDSNRVRVACLIIMFL
jgi:hypothetical protein